VLKRLVDAHPQIAITPETHWITQFADGQSVPCMVTPELVRRLFEYRTFPNLALGREEVAGLVGDRPLPYAQFVSRLFDLYGRKEGKLLVGDKTPGYARSLPLLHTLWPAAKFVHLIRDGRDVCLSVMDWKRKLPKLTSRFPTWAEEPVATAALWWDWHVSLARREGLALGLGLYHEVFYEDLVARPADECVRLCAFLGVAYDPAMLRFYEHGYRQSAISRQPTADSRLPTADKPRADAKHEWLPVTPGLRNWRAQMAADDVEYFEAVAGGLLAELGYFRAQPHPSLAALDSAAHVRNRFPRRLPVSYRQPTADSR
jgi:hypothetical protein